MINHNYKNFWLFPFSNRMLCSSVHDGALIFLVSPSYHRHKFGSKFKFSEILHQIPTENLSSRTTIPDLEPSFALSSAALCLVSDLDFRYKMQFFRGDRLNVFCHRFDSIFWLVHRSDEIFSWCLHRSVNNTLWQIRGKLKS